MLYKKRLSGLIKMFVSVLLFAPIYCFANNIDLLKNIKKRAPALDSPTIHIDAVKDQTAPSPPSPTRPSVPLDKEKKSPPAERREKNDAFHLNARLQIDLRVHDIKANPISNDVATSNNLFDIRRARLGVVFDVAPLKCNLSFDFANSVKLKNAFVDFPLFSNSKLRAGQFTYPFSNETTSSSRYHEFLEVASIGHALSASRDRGLALNSTWFDQRFYLIAGVFNGTKDSRLAQNSAFDFTMRVIWHAMKQWHDTVELWLGGAYATGRRRSSKVEDITFEPESKSGQIYFFAEFPEDRAYTRTRSSIDATLLLGPVMTKVEYLQASYDFDKAVLVQGGYAIASYMLTGEQRAIKKASLYRQQVARPVTGGQGWGAWEIAVRYSWFSVDDLFFEDDGLFTDWQAVAKDRYTDGGSAWTLAVNWYPEQRIRVMANWIRSSAKTSFFDNREDIVATPAVTIEEAFLLRFQIEL